MGAERPAPTAPTFQVPQCRCCGHALGDHASSGSGGLFPRVYGICLRPGCECSRFVSDEPRRAA